MRSPNYIRETSASRMSQKKLQQIVLFYFGGQMTGFVGSSRARFTARQFGLKRDILFTRSRQKEDTPRAVIAILVN